MVLIFAAMTVVHCAGYPLKNPEMKPSQKRLARFCPVLKDKHQSVGKRRGQKSSAAFGVILYSK
jgi:hypothetical protein